MKNIYPKVQQQTSYDCGPTCLQMILKYYKGFETLENIRKLTKTSNKGTTFYNLKKAAEVLGLTATAYHIDDEFLNKKITIPFIAHVKINNYYHYIVVYKIDKMLTIVDPSKGTLEKITKQAFKEISTNNILFMNSTKSLSKKKKYTPKAFEKEYIKREKHKLTKLTLVSFILLQLELLSTILVYVYLKIKLHLLFLVFIISVVLLIIKIVLEFIENKKVVELQLDLEEKMKKNIWNDILFSPYTSLISGKKDVLILSLRQSEEISKYFIEKHLFIMLYLPLTIILYLILIIIYKPFIFIPLYFIIETITTKYIIEKVEINKKVYQQKENIMANREINIKENIEQIRNMNLEKEISNYVITNESNFKQDTIKYIKKLLFQNNMIILPNKLFLLSMLTYLVILFNRNVLTLEEVFMSYQLLQVLEENIKQYLNLAITSAKIKVMLENHTSFKYKKIKNEKIENISLKNCRLEEFKYLKNISIKLNKKDKVLLRGKSGIGKTTLMHMIKGDIEAKNIKVNNTPISQKYNKRITYISSIPFLIDSTVLENILFNRNIDKEKLEKVLDITNLKDLKERIDIDYLSSGEMQKINLARALLNDTDVFLFDEALNQISEIEEKKIMKKILDNYSDKIIVTVTHRENLNDLFNRKVYLTEQGQLKKGEQKCLE